MKYVLDALRFPTPAEGVFRWRDGLYASKGYFVNDDAGALELAKPTQEIDRKRRGLTLTIERREQV